MVGKPNRVWFALDANFTRDDKVLEAGEAAAFLYLAILGHLALTQQRGSLTRAQVSRMGIPGWERRMERLEKAGLVESSDPDTYAIPAWEGWSTVSERALYMREWRRKRGHSDDTA